MGNRMTKSNSNFWDDNILSVSGYFYKMKTISNLNRQEQAPVLANHSMIYNFIFPKDSIEPPFIQKSFTLPIRGFILSFMIIFS